MINNFIKFFVFRCSWQPDMMHGASYLRQCVAIEHRGDRYSTHGLPGANDSGIISFLYTLPDYYLAPVAILTCECQVLRMGSPGVVCNVRV